MYNAIKSGYRLLDGAGDYGNEKQAGEGVARAIKDGLVKREDLFITSKVRASYLPLEVCILLTRVTLPAHSSGTHSTRKITQKRS